MINKCRSFITGRAFFEISGVFPSELINRCSDAGIALYDLKITKDGIEGALSEPDYEAFYAICEKMGVSSVNVRFSGLHSFLNRYKKRFGAIAGIIVFSLLLAYLSSVLWCMEIRGTKAVNKYELIGLLRQNGVETGVFLNSIQCNEIERYLSESDERILKVTANLAGCKLFVEVLEREPEIRKETELPPGDIVASKDGEIVSADVFNGISMVSVGDAVVKGDLLIDGKVPLPDGSVRIVPADGRITARTVNHVSCFVSNAVQVKTIEKRKDLYFPEFFSMRRHTPPSEGDLQFESHSAFLRSDSTIFPIGFVRERRTVLKETRRELSAEEGALICVSDAALRTVRLIEGKTYVDKKVVFRRINGMSVDLQIILEENIGIRRISEEKIEKTPD